MASENLKYYLNKTNFLKWMDEIISEDLDPSVQKSAKEIRFEVAGNCVIKPRSYHEKFYLKYKFKIITKEVGQTNQASLYYYDGFNLQLIGLIQGYTNTNQKCCKIYYLSPEPTVSLTPSLSVTPTITITPTVTPSVSATDPPISTPSFSATPTISSHH